MANSFLVSVLCTGILLTGCVSKPPLDKVVTQTKLVYPELGPVPTSPNLNIDPWHFDLPRDTSKPLEIKNTTFCKSVSVKDEAFWKKCGQYPIDFNSNLYVGLTKSEYDKYVIGMSKLKNRIVYDSNRINEENKRRLLWKKKNAVILR